MPYIPSALANSALDSLLVATGFHPEHQGKVRDTYTIPGHPDLLFVIATDRISIFDFVLGVLVPYKGEVLTALTHFWLRSVFNNVPHHLVAAGCEIDEYLPAQLRGNVDLQRCALVVKRLQMISLEVIFRSFLSGSGYKDYLATRSVCGIVLPLGLHDGSLLPDDYFTPSTKATEGHDVNVGEEQAAEIIGKEMLDRIKQFVRPVYVRGAQVAADHGILLADSKFEVGLDDMGHLTLGDEVLTPDSSRFWPAWKWIEVARQKKAPGGMDKEPVRQAGKKAILPDGATVDISKLDPKLREDQELVASWQVPAEVIEATSRRYPAALQMLTGKDLRLHQSHEMGVGQIFERI